MKTGESKRDTAKIIGMSQGETEMCSGVEAIACRRREANSDRMKRRIERTTRINLVDALRTTTGALSADCAGRKMTSPITSNMSGSKYQISC